VIPYVSEDQVIEPEWGNEVALAINRLAPNDRTPYCRVSQSGAYLLPHATVIIVDWMVEKADSDGFHDNVTFPDRIIIPAGLGGIYQVGYSVGFAPGTGFCQTWIERNASGERLASTLHPNFAGIGVQASGSDVTVLNDGDYIDCRMYQTSGGFLNVLQNPGVFGFWAVRIGPS
jgi:hypothetical protein